MGLAATTALIICDCRTNKNALSGNCRTGRFGLHNVSLKLPVLAEPMTNYFSNNIFFVLE